MGIASTRAQRHRRRLRAVAVAAIVTTLVALTGAAAVASTGSSAAGSVPPDSLRALAADIGLRGGTAVNPLYLETPAYTQITPDQFSTVTPENEMKWQLVEPTRGTYDWSGGDRLRPVPPGHGQLVRGHTLVWHSQLPTWLTDGVANGTISDAELRDLLHKHITDEVAHFKGKI